MPSKASLEPRPPRRAPKLVVLDGERTGPRRTAPVMRDWTINGRFLAQPGTGVQRYAWEIVSALDDLIADGSPWARGLNVTLAHPPLASGAPMLRAIRPRLLPGRPGHWWEQFTLPGAVMGGLISLGNTGPLSVRKQIVCMHDVNARLFPASYSLPFRALYRVLQPALGRRVARVATVSHFSASQLEAFGIAPRSKIFVAPNGHEHALRWSSRFAPAMLARGGPDTVLMIGSPAPHKNMELMLEVARRLEPDGVRLAIAGSLDQRVHQGGAATFGGNVSKLGRVDDGALAALMAESLCLAFPSFTEGFGLPVLEAMARGCPVVSSDRASMPEIGGDAILYASPEDPEAWRQAILRLRADASLRNAKIAQGRARAALFSWRESAEIYLREMAALDRILAPPLANVAQA